MGAWGHGLLENDTALDGLGGAMDMVGRDISGWTEGNEKNAARLGAAIGLLLMFSSYSFDAESPASKTIDAALAANKDCFDRLPGTSAEILTAILDGKADDWTGRMSRLPTALETAFHGEEAVERAQEEPLPPISDLFRHPEAVVWLRDLSARLAETIDEELEDDEVACDLAREASCVGSLAVLFFLGPGIVGREHLARWRERIQEVNDDPEFAEEEEDAGFFIEYHRLLNRAFATVLGEADATDA